MPCHYAECLILFIIMLNGIIPSVVILIVVILSLGAPIDPLVEALLIKKTLRLIYYYALLFIIMMNVIIPNVVILIVIMLSVGAPIDGLFKVLLIKKLSG